MSRKLSVVIPTFNEEENIVRCLKSVEDIADEIIVVDAGSKDDTRKLAKEFGVRLINVKNEPIFHKNKQKGLNAASGEWILQLDADEEVSKNLRKEIEETIIDSSYDGYYLPRKNYFLGKFMKKGGLYPDGVIRLFRKGKAHFPCKSVHEQIEVKGKIGWFKNALLHYSYVSIQDYLIKANRYTTLTAKELAKKRVKVGALNTFYYGFVLPFKTFMSIYFRHQGFLDGLHGFIWACLSSTHYFFAYGKLITYSQEK